MGAHRERLRSGSNGPRATSPLSITTQVGTGLLEDLCFEAQQAAEKAIKAVLVFKGIKLRFVHDIAELLTLPNKQRAYT